MNCCEQNLNHLIHWLDLMTLFCPNIFYNICLKLEVCSTFNLNRSNMYYNCSSKYLETCLEIFCPRWERHSPFSVTYNTEREEAKKRQYSAFILPPTQFVSLSTSFGQSFYIAACIVFSFLFHEAVRCNSPLPLSRQQNLLQSLWPTHCLAC